MLANRNLPAQAVSLTSGRYRLSVLPTLAVGPTLIGMVFTVALFCTRFYPVVKQPDVGMMSATWLGDPACVEDHCWGSPQLLIIHMARTRITVQLRSKDLAWLKRRHSKATPKSRSKPEHYDQVAAMFPVIVQEHELPAFEPSPDVRRFQGALRETMTDRDYPSRIVMMVDDGVALERVMTMLDLVFAIAPEDVLIWAPEFPEWQNHLCHGSRCCG